MDVGPGRRRQPTDPPLQETTRPTTMIGVREWDGGGIVVTSSMDLDQKVNVGVNIIIIIYFNNSLLIEKKSCLILKPYNQTSPTVFSYGV